ncbi:MAG: 4-carboxymuconolactone decarboxylase, partial [Acetobacteraceae bacterium]|nr:4-carboxymuconolactone decarboxylase [Acetobacteraceae bacterium]
YQAGLRTRRRTLGDAHVDRSLAAITDVDRDFQRFITETAWGGVWTRPHFDARTRSIITLALLAGLGREEEFKLHVRATRNTGATAEDIAELLLHVAVYAGVPAANSAMRLAKQILSEG